MTEKELDAAVGKLCRLYGWRRYHTYRSKHSPAGFPDLVLVKPPRLIFAELKSDDGSPTTEQLAWLSDLQKVMLATARFDHKLLTTGEVETYVGPPLVEAHLWRPRDLQRIASILAPRDHDLVLTGEVKTTY